MACPVCRLEDSRWPAVDVDGTLRTAPALARGVLEGSHDPRLGELLAPLLAGQATDVHDVVHRLALAGRVRAEGVPSQQGRVVQLSTSRGGVPKLPVPSSDLDVTGLLGDRQKNRKHHGRPWQAVCLWSAEVVDELQAEGHPIGYGTAGENVTVRGLDWPQLVPGTRIALGTAVLELTCWAIPCPQNRRWFSDGGVHRLGDPGRRRLYARVVQDGQVDVGDVVTVSPSVGA